MYQVVVQDEAQDAVNALPTDGLLGWFEVLDALAVDPWQIGEPWRKDKPEGNIRTLPFGPGGFVTFMVLDHDREVHVLEVYWAG
jgi:hypothetical protein